MSQVRIPEEVIHLLPKTDLHVHLDGSLRPDTLFALMEDQNVTPRPSTIEELLETVTVGERTMPLTEYLSIFGTTLRVLQDRDAIERAAYELAEDAAAENVRHLEVRFSPILHLEQGLTLHEVMDAVLAGLKRAENDFRIHTGVIVCGIRHISPERSLELAQLTVEYRGRGVVAFDLAGAEKDFPAKKHVEAFYLIRNSNMSCTVHAGEAFGPASIHQALHYCGAHRIGHGTRLREDEHLLAYVNDHRIPVEICLTSNVHVQAIGDLKLHPFKYFYDRGLRVTINTDNRLISSTTVTRELDLACRTFDLSVADLRNLVINGFKSAFIAFPEKVEMVRSAVSEIDVVLARHFPTSRDDGRTLL
jgi:adenosine deaminase